MDIRQESQHNGEKDPCHGWKWEPCKSVSNQAQLYKVSWMPWNLGYCYSGHLHNIHFLFIINTELKVRICWCRPELVACQHKEYVCSHLMEHFIQPLILERYCYLQQGHIHLRHYVTRSGITHILEMQQSHYNWLMPVVQPFQKTMWLPHWWCQWQVTNSIQQSLWNFTVVLLVK